MTQRYLNGAAFARGVARNYGTRAAVREVARLASALTSGERKPCPEQSNGLRAYVAGSLDACLALVQADITLGREVA